MKRRKNRPAKRQQPLSNRRQRFLAKAAADYRRELADLDGTCADGLEFYAP